MLELDIRRLATTRVSRALIVAATGVAVLAAAGWADQSQEVDLVLSLPKGEVVRFEVRRSATVTSRIGESEVKTTNEYTQIVSWRFASVEDGLLVYELELGRIAGTLQIPFGGTFEFDSDRAEDKPPVLLASAIASLTEPVGHRILIWLTERGRVTKVAGWAEVLKGTPAEQLAMMGTPLSNDSYVQEVQELIPLLPEGPVSLGSIWEGRREIQILDHSIGFLPVEKMRSLDDNHVGWSFAAAMTEGALANSEHTSEASGENRFFVQSLTVHDASVLGRALVSRMDGLPLSYSLDVMIACDMEGPLGIGLIPTTSTSRVSVERLEGGD